MYRKWLWKVFGKLSFVFEVWREQTIILIPICYARTAANDLPDVYMSDSPLLPTQFSGTQGDFVVWGELALNGLTLWVLSYFIMHEIPVWDLDVGVFSCNSELLYSVCLSLRTSVAMCSSCWLCLGMRIIPSNLLVEEKYTKLQGTALSSLTPSFSLFSDPWSRYFSRQSP